MWYLLLLLLLLCPRQVQPSILKLSCGTTSDITNVNTEIQPDSTGMSTTFSKLDTSCYGRMKSTLLNLQSATKEGEKCQLQADSLLHKLDVMCSYIMPLDGFAAKFERILKIIKALHKNMNKITKFADNIPKIGKLRKAIVGTIMPLVLDVLERLSKEIRRVIDYEKILLKFKKTAKLLWKIDKQGSKACKLTSPVGLSLNILSKTVKEVNKVSKVVLQTTNQVQECMSSYCRRNGDKSSCSECQVADRNFDAVRQQIATWEGSMVSCHTKLGQVNSLIAKLNVISSIIQLGKNIIDEIDSTLRPIAEKINKFAESAGAVVNNMMSCCPCGRPNKIGCSISMALNTVKLISCPLNGITDELIKAFMNKMKGYISDLLNIHLPVIDVKFTLPISNFAVIIPPFLQQCLKETSYGKKFTKFCGMSNEKLSFSITASLPSTKEVALFSGGSLSIEKQIAKSCSEALNAMLKLGSNMATCFDSIEDVLFFAIPQAGFLAAMTCDPKFKDPDPGINYCPCKSMQDSLFNKDAKQPYCVVWHKSWMKTCASTCTEKKYEAGKNKAGKTALMSTTEGYPHCDKLKYYCREANVIVQNGKLKCDNEYTYLGGSCEVVPNPGYVCPLSHIHCGYISKGKTVCWNYRFIACSKDDGKHYPICSCRNKFSGGFSMGQVVCQTGVVLSSETAEGVNDVQNSFSCFEPLGRYESMKQDCGENMFPCVIQQPKLSAYQRCEMSKVEKIWDAHKKKVSIAGAVILGLFTILAISAVCAYRKDSSKKYRLSAAACIIIAVLGLVMLICSVTIKTAEEHSDNYIRMGAE